MTVVPPPSVSLLDLAERIFHETELACFVAGSCIDTVSGEIAVEEITAGTLVLTADHGPQPVRRVLSKTVSGRGALAPVCFDAGVLGNHRPLLVSPNHRMMVWGWRAEILTGEPEVLVPADLLAQGSDRIRSRPMDSVTYYHLLFDRHEIIFSQGAPSESYQPFGQDAEERAPAVMAELRALFPELVPELLRAAPARPCMAPHEAALLRL
ncbi:Hint domain-containing protein [Paragemmobacter straminiformis]|uniref:Hint domain-containing protein n=1 Tax=Paragemmobacter straminiformis TaxID=2045119 RepID=A0A842I244_9RHOB|nr:Hint domain-containing protein [Gemmobacter straminiformis]MBC2833936.1 Hint domain-containing protein [Gemmobacter straminiformis]